jgi:hypothetical protein
VHKAKVTRTASGPMVVSLKLLGLRRRTPSPGAERSPSFR